MPPPFWDRNPAWAGRSELMHGTLRRQGLETRGKLSFTEMITLGAPALEALAGPDAVMIGADQVHGDAVSVIRGDADLAGALRSQAGSFAAYEFPETDALVCDFPGRLLVIQTADCLPILFHEPRAGIVAACHCGWRGLMARLAAKTAREMSALGADPERIEAWVGPGIGVECYEVGPDLAGKFEAAFPRADAISPGHKLDLVAVARAQLRDAGLDQRNISAIKACTAHEADKYHSYRRDAGQAGRLLTVIGVR